ncbi:hypothetical protein AAGG74_17430 [Bacillus mexicanus]|uniref:5' nucleotidase, NT5C type n=1 Tax=Bacillus mexicanus TaxID=2834415 RepID=UPI003D1E82A8
MIHAQETSKKQRPVILVDMDDTLADFAKSYWNIHNEIFGEKINHKKVDDWDLSKFSSKGKDCYKIFKYPGLFRELEVKPYAKEFMKNLQEIADVYIVSDSPTGTAFQESVFFDANNNSLNQAHTSNPADDKRMWVKEHFPDFPQSNIIFCSCKWMIQGDILIDDKPSTFERFQEEGRKAILIDMPFNQHIDTGWRARDLKEAESIIRDLYCTSKTNKLKSPNRYPKDYQLEKLPS